MFFDIRVKVQEFTISSHVSQDGKSKALGVDQGSSNRSNTRKSVSSDFQTPRSRLEKRGGAEFFLTNFEVFGNRRKHSFDCLI